MSYINGLLSVIIPTYRRSDMLYRAIESVLNQTYNDVECIVVNDNNPDDEYSKVLYEKLDKYKGDNRFHFLEQEHHINGAAARNVGIRAAKGEFIAFLDDDDFWDSIKAQVQIEVLKNLSEEWGAVSCLMKLYKNGVVVSAPRPYRDGYIHIEVLTRCISMGTGSLIIRRCALDETGYFDENLRRYQDPQLFSSLTERYKVRLVKRYLHNRDVDDAQNRPSIENIDAFHDAFFKSVAPQFERLPKNKSKQVEAIYDLDRASVYLRNGKRAQALKFILGLFRYPVSIRYAIRRIYNRISERMFIESRIAKYK